MATPCAHVKPDGTQCRAHARKGGSLCFLHDPGSRTAAQEARASGGKRATWRPAEVEPVRLETEGDAKAIAASVINDLRAGAMEPGVANAIVNACSMGLRAMAQGTVDGKLRELEDKLRPLKGLSAEQLEALLEADGASAEGH